ncbi:hypothetical protein H696_01619 [Fonticula alba]|uniref:Uncharacterized protein n=1 Tax=Fonticula alba TaxID=691883 RepID=A0A058ZCV9_FONAL|nr:hypothetical protein H696_01619 [Fonticula alba]KCV72219.1 hypothetical protein H696_01619 [Fonticula alba]|eukprot:XP_009493797.1 hypothetical protein H696_01619 [Fonticula alba]
MRLVLVPAVALARAGRRKRGTPAQQPGSAKSDFSPSSEDFSANVSGEHSPFPGPGEHAGPGADLSTKIINQSEDSALAGAGHPTGRDTDPGTGSSRSHSTGHLSGRSSSVSSSSSSGGGIRSPQRLTSGQGHPHTPAHGYYHAEDEELALAAAQHQAARRLPHAASISSTVALRSYDGRDFDPEAAVGMGPGSGSDILPAGGGFLSGDLLGANASGLAIVIDPAEEHQPGAAGRHLPYGQHDGLSADDDCSEYSDLPPMDEYSDDMLTSTGECEGSMKLRPPEGGASSPAAGSGDGRRRAGKPGPGAALVSRSQSGTGAGLPRPVSGETAWSARSSTSSITIEIDCMLDPTAHRAAVAGLESQLQDMQLRRGEWSRSNSRQFTDLEMTGVAASSLEAENAVAAPAAGIAATNADAALQEPASGGGISEETETFAADDEYDEEDPSGGRLHHHGHYSYYQHQPHHHPGDQEHGRGHRRPF